MSNKHRCRLKVWQVGESVSVKSWSQHFVRGVVIGAGFRETMQKTLGLTNEVSPRSQNQVRPHIQHKFSFYHYFPLKQNLFLGSPKTRWWCPPWYTKSSTCSFCAAVNSFLHEEFVTLFGTGMIFPAQPVAAWITVGSQIPRLVPPTFFGHLKLSLYKRPFVRL